MQISSINSPNDYQSLYATQEKENKTSPVQIMAQNSSKEATSGEEATPKQVMQLNTGSQTAQNGSQLAQQQIVNGRLDIKI